MLQVTVDKDNNEVILNGEVDIATSGQFEEAIMELVEANVPKIRLNMSDMEYIDSTGIGILMAIRKNSIGDDQEIILVKPKRSIVKLMQLTGVDQIFNIES